MISRRDIIATYLRADVDILADIEGTVRNRTTGQVAAQLTQKMPGALMSRTRPAVARS